MNYYNSQVACFSWKWGKKFEGLGTKASSNSASCPLWSGTNKNRDVSTGPLARPFARSLAPLTRSLAPDCSLRLRPLPRSLVRSLVRSLPRSWGSDWLDCYFVCIFFIFDHSGIALSNSASCLAVIWLSVWWFFDVNNHFSPRVGIVIFWPPTCF